MDKDAYVWYGNDGWTAVHVVERNSYIWRLWLYNTDARKRKYLKDEDAWLMHPDLRDNMLSRFSNLNWKVSFQKPNRTKNKKLEESDSPYESFYLLPSAPKCVIDAAYKAMVLSNHPDRGGDAEICKKLNQAKDKIYKERGW